MFSTYTVPLYISVLSCLHMLSMYIYVEYTHIHTKYTRFECACVMSIQCTCVLCLLVCHMCAPSMHDCRCLHIGYHHAHDAYIMDGLACAVLLYICIYMQALCVVSAPKCGSMCGPQPLPLSLRVPVPWLQWPWPTDKAQPLCLTGERYWCLHATASCWGVTCLSSPWSSPLPGCFSFPLPSMCRARRPTLWCLPLCSLTGQA